MSKNFKCCSMKFKDFHVVFSQDCNMRCSYCTTGYGRYGRSRKGYMSKDIQKSFIEFALAHVREKDKISFQFGGGETFVYFEEFVDFADAMRVSFNDKKVNLSVATNGILLDEERLFHLAERGMALTFSLDAPKSAHDRYRRRHLNQSYYDKTF